MRVFFQSTGFVAAVATLIQHLGLFLVGSSQ